MNALEKIANYFRNFDGEDECVANIQFSTNDLRFIAQLNVELGRAKESEKIVKCLRHNHPQMYEEVLNELGRKVNEVNYEIRNV